MKKKKKRKKERKKKYTEMLLWMFQRLSPRIDHILSFSHKQKREKQISLSFI